MLGETFLWLAVQGGDVDARRSISKNGSRDPRPQTAWSGRPWTQKPKASSETTASLKMAKTPRRPSEQKGRHGAHSGFVVQACKPEWRKVKNQHRRKQGRGRERHPGQHGHCVRIACWRQR